MRLAMFHKRAFSNIIPVIFKTKIFNKNCEMCLNRTAVKGSLTSSFLKKLQTSIAQHNHIKLDWWSNYVSISSDYGSMPMFCTLPVYSKIWQQVTCDDVLSAQINSPPRVCFLICVSTWLIRPMEFEISINSPAGEPIVRSAWLDGRFVKCNILKKMFSFNTKRRNVN